VSPRAQLVMNRSGLAYPLFKSVSAVLTHNQPSMPHRPSVLTGAIKLSISDLSKVIPFVKIHAEMDSVLSRSLHHWSE